MSCLDDQTVLRFVAGQLDAAARAVVEAELARCSRCTSLVAAMLSDGEDATETARYQLGAAIARGGMGTIFSAIDKKLGREIAVKRLDTHTPTARIRFEREVALTASLQHPNIVPIYDVGELPDGRPFYAMRHVIGETLDAMIARAQERDQRLALLAPILSAADAIAYAHQHGVVHRDLKPLNILVGRFGETVVIDWGLAKRAGDRDAPPGADGDSELGLAVGSVVDATRTGTVLGTPRYMAPEQARGLPATAASDVYALGAVLYHALVGEPPFDGGQLVLARVAAGDVVPLAERAPNLPRDLTAIVERAMAVATTDRYATACELADDLRRFQTGQLVSAYRYSRPDRVRRFVRRHRLALAVAASFATVTVVVGATSVAQIVHERDLADAANARAEQHRSGAEELMQFMLSDLRRTLSKVGRLDALTGVADRVDGFLERVDAGSPAGLRAKASVLELRAQIASSQGQTDRAEQLAETARALLDLDAAVAPGSIVAQRIRAALALHRGADATRVHDDALALRGYREAAELWRGVVAVDPEAAANLVGSLTSIAETADRLGDRDEVERSRREATEVLDRALQRQPDDPDLGLRKALLDFSIGQAALRRGDLAGAEREFRTGLAAAEAVRARDPSSVDVLRSSLMLLNELADTRIARGGDKEAAQLHERARALAEQAVAIEPTNTKLREALARSWRELARDALGAGDGDSGAARLELAVAEYERLVAADRGDRRVARLAAIANAELGRTQGERRRESAARAAMVRAVALFAELANAGDPATRLDLAFALREQAYLERTMSRLPAARAAIARAVVLVEETPAQPDRPTQDFYRAAVLAEAAAIEKRGGTAARAREYGAAASAIADDLEHRGVLQPDWRTELGMSQ